MTPTLVITPGEPAGIGPDLVVRLAAAPRASRWCAVADPELLAARARHLGVALTIRTVDDVAALDDDAALAGTLYVRPETLDAPCEPGTLDVRNAAYVLRTLDAATDACLAGAADALVTAPVHKGVIADSGVPFSGHTEYLAARTRADGVLMVLVAGRLRVALVTTHLPLAAVPAAITRDAVAAALERLVDGLRLRYGIEAPTVLVAGLNPHAGEGGHLGREEIDVIEPVCAAARADGLDVRGPLPADTLFTPALLEGADAVLAMYHDQGLPVLKHAGFGRAVNVTFGLPIVRTSVDHGTALDLAGSDRADTGSLAAAIAAAEAMAHRRRETRT
jgi:4-hydroxythreonine-4-phosphate dehydrogenase